MTTRGVSPRLRWAWALALLIPVLGSAAEMASLYEAQVLVTGQGASERSGALRGALAEVVVKLTGDRSSATHPKLALTLERAADLVQKYEYEPLASMATPAGDAAATPAYTHVMRVSFDAQAVNGALRGAGFPVWGRVRPLTMVWLAVQESGGQRYVVGADAGNDGLRPMLDAAARRGIPLVLPTMDLEDQLAVSVADVWAGFQDRLAEASRRYQADAILVGRARHEASGWQVTWSFYQGNHSDQWESSGTTRNAALTAGVDKASDLLAQRFARIFALAENNVVELRVSDVRTLEDYARVMRYLVSLDSTAAVQLSQVEPGRALFAVTIESSREGLRQTLALGHVLAVDTAAPRDREANGEMSYRLLP